MNLDRIIAVRNNKTIYRDGNLCIKVFNENFSKADILNEALNHSRAENTGLNVPKLREVTTIDGKWAIVYDYANGKSVSALMKEHPEKRNEYIGRIADIQTKIHQKKCPLLNRQSDKINMKIDLSDFSPETKSALKEKLSEIPEHFKLCHGDFNPSNVIISPDGGECIIDWSHASIGNASADAAWTYLSFLLRDDSAGAAEYLCKFCELSEINESCITDKIPLAAAAKFAAANERERKFLAKKIKID